MRRTGANLSKTEVFRSAEYASVRVHQALRANQCLLDFVQRLRRSDRRQRQIWLLLGCIQTQQQFLAELGGPPDPPPGVLIRFGWHYWSLLTGQNYGLYDENYN